MDQVLENGVSVEGYMDVVQLHHQGSNCPLAGDLLVIPASYTLGRPGQLTTGTSRYLCAEFARATNIPYHVTVSVISQDNVPSMWPQLHCLVSWAIQYQPPETHAFFQPRHWQEINRQKRGSRMCLRTPGRIACSCWPVIAWCSKSNVHGGNKDLSLHNRCHEAH